MGTSTFTGSTSLTIHQGTTVKFADAASGATHILMMGANGMYGGMMGAPNMLNSSMGMTISPGQTMMVTFTTPGTYHITCSIHPDMNVTITVR